MDEIRIGSVGLGRLGYEHAKNLAGQVRNGRLCAICDVDEKRLGEVATELQIEKTYTDFEKMCADKDLDAIVIVSPSAFHADQIQTALDAGKHVFCEKPLDTTVAKCKQAERSVEAHPDRVFMLGFMRRYDVSYQKAIAKIRSGAIGRVSLVRSYTEDPISAIESVLKFAPHSGGQFIDMSVHDIDLVRWFTGSDPQQVWAIGDTYEFTQMADWKDTDQSAAMMQCANGAMAFIYSSRTAANGSNIETEIIGTKGELRIGSVGADSMLEEFNEHGICRGQYSDFVKRWHQAYINEMNEFVACIREKRHPEVTVYDGTKASAVAYACKDSYENGGLRKIVY